MTNVGETLRRERQRRGIDLQEVAREIKIRPKLLEYIEAEQFERLPGGVFAKSFVKQYADLLGLDGEGFAAEVQRQIQPSAPVNPPSQAPPPPAPAPFQAPAWEVLGERRSSSTIPSLILVVMVIVGCSFAYNWWATREARREEVPQMAARTEVPPASQPEASPAQPAAAAIHEPPAATPEPAAVRPAAVIPADPNAPMQVTLAASEDTWVSAHADGKYVFSGTLAANQSRTLQAASGIRLLVGNAGGLAVSLNGKPVGPIGPRGQVRVVELTPAGAEVQTKKPAAESPAAIPDVL